MANMEIYEACREVPEKAKKSIGAGRLKGMTDINPMWRIKKLTEVFGPCGIGWYYELTRQWSEDGADGVKCAFCNIDLFVKHNGEWSNAIKGTGGSTFIAKEKSGLYTSDECYKMALTDAISVACKQLGIGADVYWSQDNTKYSKGETEQEKKERERRAGELMLLIADTKTDLDKVLKSYGVEKLEDMSKENYENCKALLSKRVK